jgi:hypothetical protein
MSSSKKSIDSSAATTEDEEAVQTENIASASEIVVNKNDSLLFSATSYFDKYFPQFDKYIRAYVSSGQYDKLKSKSEWDALVKKHMNLTPTEE